MLCSLVLKHAARYKAVQITPAVALADALMIARGVCRPPFVKALCYNWPVSVTSRRLTSLNASRSLSPKPPYRVLFAGSERFSCTILKALADAKTENSNLICELHVAVPPDKRTSRGLKKVHRPAIRSLAEDLSLPVHVLPLQGISAWKLPEPFDSYDNANIFIAASFGYLVPNHILDDFPEMNSLNVHPSLLPKYRGAAPIQHCIANGDSETGVTIQSLSRGKFDEGKILAQRSITLPSDRVYAYHDLEDKLARAGADLLVKTLQGLPTAQANAMPQDVKAATLARKVSSDDVQIPWSSHTATHIHRLHRAFAHQFPLWTTHNGRRVQILSADPATLEQHSGHSSQPGDAVFDRHSGDIDVSCAHHTILRVHALKTENRKELAASEWWKGAASSKGLQVLRFGT